MATVATDERPASVANVASQLGPPHEALQTRLSGGVVSHNEPIFDELRSLLIGKGLPRCQIECINATVKGHEGDNAAMSAANSLRPSGSPRDGAPKQATTVANTNDAAILLKTVTYVAAAILVDSENRVLMIQEAKPECHSTWYLPAGRVERGERLIDAAKREVLEESGMQVELVSLVAIEMSHRGWFRFIFCGNVRGGQLKTPDKADKESLQASWLPVEPLTKRTDRQHKLRSLDIGWLLSIAPPIINQLVRDRTAAPLLPIAKPRDRMYFCSVVAFREESSIYVLASEHRIHNNTQSPQRRLHLPVTLLNPKDSAFYDALDRLLKTVFKKDSPIISYDPLGLLAVEHDPIGSTDGVLFAVMVTATTPDRRLPPVRARDFQWVAVPSGIHGNGSTDIAGLLSEKIAKKDVSPVIINL